jgi:hypothetical protein
MQLTPAAAVALAAVSLLAACGPKGGNATAAAGGVPTAGGAPAVAAAPAGGPDVQINIADLPHYRGGLWRNVIDTGDGKPITITSCLSGKALAMPHLPPCFNQFSVKRTFQGAYVIDSTCESSMFTMVTHTVLTGDFQTNVSSDGATTTTTKQAAPEVSKLHTQASYLGPCAPGQTPEDEQGPPSGGG